MFVKRRFFETSKRELLLLINLLGSRVHVSWLWCKLSGKNQKNVNSQCVERTWSDQNSIVKIPLDQCVEVQYLLNITSKVQLCFQIITILGEVTLEIHASI